jgi:hypothetical protein
MLRQFGCIAVLLFFTCGCSLLHPAPVEQVESAKEATSSESLIATTHASNSVDGAESPTSGRDTDDQNDGDNHKMTIGKAAFGVVFIPTYFVGCFVWWIAHGCPDA